MYAVSGAIALCLFCVSGMCNAQSVGTCITPNAFKAFQEKNEIPLLIKAERVRPMGKDGLVNAKKKTKVGGVEMTLSEQMESRYQVATHAEEYATKAISEGRISAKEREEYISTSKRLLYLLFKQNNYDAGWIGFAYSPNTKNGYLVMRDYTITEKGDVINDRDICIASAITNVRFLLDDKVAAQKLEESNKSSAFCDAEMNSLGYSCGSLRDALRNAYGKNQGLISLADSENQKIVITGRPEQGSLFFVARDGTANEFAQLFNIKVDPSLLKR